MGDSIYSVQPGKGWISILDSRETMDEGEGRTGAKVQTVNGHRAGRAESCGLELKGDD